MNNIFIQQFLIGSPGSAGGAAAAALAGQRRREAAAAQNKEVVAVRPDEPPARPIEKDREDQIIISVIGVGLGVILVLVWLATQIAENVKEAKEKQEKPEPSDNLNGDGFGDS